MIEEEIIQKKIRVNNAIRVPEVRVIGLNSEQIGVLPTPQALLMAEESGVDLVEVAPSAKPPVCRIMDYSKFKYEQEKKEKKARKKAHIVHVKQIRIKPNIDDHDFETKVNQGRAFLEKKNKVRVNLFFSGREMAFKDTAQSLLARFITETEDLAQMEKDVTTEGRIMSIVLAPKSEKV